MESIASGSLNRVKYFCKQIDERAGNLSLPLLSVSIYRGVVPRSELVGDEPRADDLSIYKVCQPGDIVVNRMSAFQGALGVSRVRGIVSPDYMVLRSPAASDSRFLAYLFSSKWFVAQMGARLRGIGVAGQGNVRTPRINWSDMGGIFVPMPCLGEQRRIADFLDVEIRRINDLSALRNRQNLILPQAWLSGISSVISDLFSGHGSTSMRRICTWVEQGWSPQCEDALADEDEWSVLKTSSVSSGVFDPLSSKRLPRDVPPELRYIIRDGDLLLTRGSGSADLVGVASVARTYGRRLLLSDLLYRVKLMHGWLPEFVALALQSPQIRSSISLLMRGQSGQTIKLRSEDVKNIYIPNVPTVTQKEIVSSMEEKRSTIQSAQDAITRSVDLLEERKRALITAAVTGQIDVTTARGADLS